jgi:AAA+ ATPase superfamily predicted ATPase
MKLTKQQKDAIKALKKFNNVIVQAPRRSGKTELIKYIIGKNKDKKIGLSARFNPEVYTSYKNVSTYNPKEEYDLVIGDENIISSKNKTICLGTFIDVNIITKSITSDTIILVWSIYNCPWWNIEELEKVRLAINKEQLKSEFFI